MLEGGEDPRFIARRMVILASEDVGNADPQALLVADGGGRGGRPGRPAGVRAQPRAGRRLPGAGAEVERLHAGDRRRPAPTSASTAPQPPPDYLRDAHYPGAAKLGRGTATSTPTTSPAASPASRCCRRASRAGASTSRPTAASRQSCGGGWRRCGSASGTPEAPQLPAGRRVPNTRPSLCSQGEPDVRGRRFGLGTSGRMMPAMEAATRRAPARGGRQGSSSSRSTLRPASWSARSTRHPGQVQAIVDDVAEVQPALGRADARRPRRATCAGPPTCCSTRSTRWPSCSHASRASRATRPTRWS